jgi:hypothetical protein
MKQGRQKKANPCALRTVTVPICHGHQHRLATAKTWTYSTWVKRANLGGTQLFGIGSGDSWMIRFSTSNKIACNFAKDTATYIQVADSHKSFS